MWISYLYTLAILFGGCYSSWTYDGRSFISLHCRDNDNNPVDWWYIYKPPGDLFPSKSGHNFSYITPKTAGKWHASNVPIDQDSMLVNTVLPMYKRSLKDSVAVAIYQNRYAVRKEINSQTVARGILMADAIGGFLLTHTVPGFPNIRKDHPEFPPEESGIGHLLVCISLDIQGINNVARAVNKISPNFVKVNIPERLEDRLPAWNFENVNPAVKRKMFNIDFNIGGNGNTSVSLVARPPGTQACLYKTFAEKQRVDLNVYGQSRKEYLTTVCGKDFGVRNIDIISLKYPEEVHYIVNSTDRTWFAVSTAASWQQKGGGPVQYWTCTSSADREEVGVGALLLCIQNFGIWRTFDNLKVKEPEC